MPILPYGTSPDEASSSSPDDDQILHRVDPSTVQSVDLKTGTLQPYTAPPPAMTPEASHAPTGRFRRRAIMPLTAGSPLGTLQDMFAAKSDESPIAASEVLGDNPLGQLGDTVQGHLAPGSAASDAALGVPQFLFGQLPYNVSKYAAEVPGMRALSEAIYGKGILEHTYGPDLEPNVAYPSNWRPGTHLTGGQVPAGWKPGDPLPGDEHPGNSFQQGATAADIAAWKAATEQDARRSGAPQYGPFSDVLTPKSTSMAMGNLAGALPLILYNPELAELLPAELATLPAVVTALKAAEEYRIAAATNYGRVGRIAARVPEAVRQGVIGAGLGAAQNQDATGGAMYGAGFGGVIGGGRTAAEVGQAADRWVEGAGERVGYAISPTKEVSKVFVKKNAEDIIRTTHWFDTLDKLHTRVAQEANDAGAAIDTAMTAARQPGVGPELGAVRKRLQTVVDDLLRAHPEGDIIMAPEARDALQKAQDVLSRLNPQDTDWTTLQRVSDTVQGVIRDVGPELKQQAKSASLQRVTDTIDTALSRDIVPATQDTLRDVDTVLNDTALKVKGSRIATGPIIDALEKAKGAFGVVTPSGVFNATDQQAIEYLTEMQHQIASHGPELSGDALRQYRQQWAEKVAGPQGRGWIGGTIADESLRGTRKTGTKILMDEFGRLRPEVLPLNREYHLKAGLSEALENTAVRRTGQHGGLTNKIIQIGALLGATGHVSLPHMVETIALPALWKLWKSPEFALFSAKTRLLIADAVRTGVPEKVKAVVQRIALEQALHADDPHADATGGMDLTQEEETHEADRIAAGLGPTPGITDRANPDAVYAEQPPGTTPPPPPDAVPGQLPEEPDASAPAPGDPDYVPGLDGPAGEADPGDQSRLTPAQRRANGLPAGPVSMAGVGDLNSPSALLDWSERPVVNAPQLTGNHPHLQRMLDIGTGALTPQNIAFAGLEGVAPFVEGTAAAPYVRGAARGVSGLVAASGARSTAAGVRAGSVPQVAGGVIQTLLGAAGMREGGVAGTAGEVAEGLTPAAARAKGFASRIARGATNMGKAAVIGPAIGVASMEAADSDLAKRLIPDDRERQAWFGAGGTLAALAALMAHAHIAGGAKAPKTTPVSGVGDVTVTRGPNFSTEGGYHVTLPDGRTFPIYRDTGEMRQWLVQGADSIGISGFTRDELIQRLATLDESKPAVDQYSGRRTGTIGEMINKERVRQGLPVPAAPEVRGGGAGEPAATADARTPAAVRAGKAPRGAVTLATPAETAMVGARSAAVQTAMKTGSKTPFKGIALRGAPAANLGETLTADASRLRPETVDRFGHLVEIGNQLEHQSNWEGATNEELLQAFRHDPQMADFWARLWGAMSPNTDVPRTTAESLSALLYHIEHPDLPYSVPSARHLTEPTKIGSQVFEPDQLPFMERPVFPNSEEGTTGAITQARSKVPNANLARRGEEFGPESHKVKRMATYMQGKGGVPLDVHAIYGLTGERSALDAQYPSLRAAMKETSDVKAVSNAAIYSHYEQALQEALREIDPTLNENRVFGVGWEGARAHKGLSVAGGPLDILRKKGLLEFGAMLDPDRLRAALQDKGWSAFAIAGLLAALGRNASTSTAVQETSDRQ